MQQQTIPGIIGGLGPLAHIEFERLLIALNSARGAKGDRDHPVWILINATDIPDRTQSLLGKEPSCTPGLVKYGRMLEGAGADFVVIPCNTSHGFHDAVQSQLKIPWIHLMEATVKFIKHRYPDRRQVGILATTGTLRTHLYDDSLEAAGLRAIAPVPDSQLQQDIMDAIYHPVWGVKATGIKILAPPIKILENALIWLETQGAELAIAGCTEISVALARFKYQNLTVVDPLEILADLTLDLAWGDRPLPKRERQ